MMNIEDSELIDIYERAKRLELESDFIELLETELKRRGIFYYEDFDV